jgi:hypothetical protein
MLQYRLNELYEIVRFLFDIKKLDEFSRQKKNKIQEFHSPVSVLSISSFVCGFALNCVPFTRRFSRGGLS